MLRVVPLLDIFKALLDDSLVRQDRNLSDSRLVGLASGERTGQPALTPFLHPVTQRAPVRLAPFGTGTVGLDPDGLEHRAGLEEAVRETGVQVALTFQLVRKRHTP